MMRKVDFLILGSGGAGGWLALEMHRVGLSKTHSVVLIDKEIKSADDRTWCFWGTPSRIMDLEPLIVKKWQQHDWEGRHVAMAPYEYCYVSASAFYSAVQKVQPITKAKVMDMQSTPDGVIVRTSEGDYLANYVFNGLNAKPAESIQLSQSFWGWRVQMPKGIGSVNAIRLMDFSIRQNNQTQFIYVLPFSENESLVEVTRFAKTPLSRDEAWKILEEYLGQTNLEYTHEETGVIPMSSVLDASTKLHPSDSRIIPLGIQAGAAKPTTGYAFLRMRNHAKKIVEALRSNQPIPTTYRKYRFRLYDRILLYILEHQPGMGKHIFSCLFKKVPHAIILKFLDEETCFLEELHIFNALPKRLFLSSLIKVLR
jgi:lycopene beta-cyclase